MKRFTLLNAILISGLIFLPSLAYSKLPAGFKESLVVKPLPSPVTFGFAPDGRMFICEQTGEIRIFKDGQLLETLFLKLEVDSQGEHGVLGIAFDPQFESNHYVYVYHTTTKPELHNRVSRFTADGDVAKPGSEQILLDLDPLLGSIYHSAGAMRFGPDGKLYAGVGDNASRPSPQNAQILTNPFGKILRINSDGTIPQDNPFFAMTSGLYRSIWARGFRNPFTFAFVPNTNRIYVNDVGANEWEEINDVSVGENFGWPDVAGISDSHQFKNPVFAYSHGPGAKDETGCAISGGAFYNTSHPTYPDAYTGKYFFIDYCSNWMRVLNPEDHTVTTFAKDLAPNPVSLEVGPDGSLYYMSRWLRGIYRITYQQP